MTEKGFLCTENLGFIRFFFLFIILIIFLIERSVLAQIQQIWSPPENR